MRIRTALLALIATSACDAKKVGPKSEPAKAVEAVPAPVVAAPPPAPPVDASPAKGPTFADGIKVTPKQLYADYSSNEVSADDKYKGNLLAVTGIVRKIAKDMIDDRPFIQLEAGQFNEVYAYVADDDGWLAKMKKGMKVEMLCRGAGVSLSTPILKPCNIEHVYVRQ